MDASFRINRNLMPFILLLVKCFFCTATGVFAGVPASYVHMSTLPIEKCGISPLSWLTPTCALDWLNLLMQNFSDLLLASASVSHCASCFTVRFVIKAP